jgi:spore coat polysaccharide biosynthesis protein SpsF (cytidylyltransferase family)
MQDNPMIKKALENKQNWLVQLKDGTDPFKGCPSRWTTEQVQEARSKRKFYEATLTIDGHEDLKIVCNVVHYFESDKIRGQHWINRPLQVYKELVQYVYYMIEHQIKPEAERQIRSK